MYYAPHILLKKTKPSYVTDEDGCGVPLDEGDEWQSVCCCRCDESELTEVSDDNGKPFVPSFHVVCEPNGKVKAGDIIRCVWADRPSVIKGEGTVRKSKTLNKLRYVELWM